MRDGLKWVLTGARKEKAPAPVELAMQPDPERAGICCSGGGIRSASFNLGALQALQAAGVMQKAKYLSAVSGGSYIAAAFCMVANSAGGAKPAVTLENPPFAPGSPEEQFVRNHVSYMAPNGLAKGFLFFRVLMGLVFNLIFLGVPIAIGGALLAVGLYQPFYDGEDDLIGDACQKCETFGDIPGWAWIVLAGLAFVAALLGFLSLLVRFGKDDWRLALETWTMRILLALGGAALVLVVVPELIELFFGDSEQKATAPAVGDNPELPAAGAAGLATLLGGVFLHLRGGKADKEIEKGWRAIKALPSRLRMGLVYLIGAIVGPGVLLAIGVWAATVVLANNHSALENLAGAAVVFALWGGLYFLTDLNTLSLHPFYRRRLSSAFALERVWEHGSLVAKERKYDDLVTLSKSKVDPGPGGQPWPTLLVCASANVSDPGATPPGRGVTPFTFTPDKIGGPLVRKVDATEYEKRLGKNRRRDITLPAAVAVSGAAVSPSMGKLTRAPLRFLMALANVRLGVWIPNPRRIEEWAAQAPEAGVKERNDYLHRPRPSYLFRELIGRNRLDARFLYVTDGGHYENLGLVELLRRGCMTVYCIDAGGGKGTRDLGDAIALARSELNVDITISGEDLVESGAPPFAKQCVQRGTIKYPGVDEEGKLVYVRSVMTKDLSWDVLSFRDVDPIFPHHSTMDQLYTDQKFEAYRALGQAAGRKAIVAMEADPAVEEPETSGSVD